MLSAEMLRNTAWCSCRVWPTSYFVCQATVVTRISPGGFRLSSSVDFQQFAASPEKPDVCLTPGSRKKSFSWIICPVDYLHSSRNSVGPAVIIRCLTFLETESYQFLINQRLLVASFISLFCDKVGLATDSSSLQKSVKPVNIHCHTTSWILVFQFSCITKVFSLARDSPA